MGHCFVHMSSSSVEQKITNAAERILICFSEYKNQGGAINVTGNLTTKYTIIAPPNTVSYFFLCTTLYEYLTVASYNLILLSAIIVSVKGKMPKNSLPAYLKHKWLYTIRKETHAPLQCFSAA